jgi:hypothetical protein
MTDAFPLPFDFERVGSASRTFCVTLVARRASSLALDVDGPATGTVNHASHQPTYSTALYQLKK